MIHAVDARDVLPRRRLTAGVTGNAHWRTDFLGQASDGHLKESAQAYLLEMTPGEVLLPHFHAVDQFQIFVAGNGGIGRTHTDVTPVLVLNGSVLHGDKVYPAWSVLYSDAAGDAIEVGAGAGGAELLVLQFPFTPPAAAAP